MAANFPMAPLRNPSQNSDSREAIKSSLHPVPPQKSRKSYQIWKVEDVVPAFRLQNLVANERSVLHNCGSWQGFSGNGVSEDGTNVVQTHPYPMELKDRG